MLLFLQKTAYASFLLKFNLCILSSYFCQSISYRQCAVAYTDFWRAYALVFPTPRHKSVGKESGKTNYIERFNCTMRQRVSRLVRKTLSFSKKLENLIGAIWFFIHHYNSSLLV